MCYTSQPLPTSPLTYYPVYVGAWTNWSRGQIMGATLTLPRRDADLLIAFTAFFVAFVTTRVWRLICFAIHRSSSKETPQDSTYHQHQAILRNSSTPEDGIRLLTYVLRANKSSTVQFRPLTTVAVAAVCIISFTIAGGFSSYISTAIGDEVLVKSLNCGAMIRDDGSFDNTIIRAYRAEQINNAANYAQQCYSSEGRGLLDCSRFAAKRIIGNIDRNATCPFQNDMCRNRYSNIRIDSGYLSSHDHFGLNSPSGQRVLWRNVYHCAPMVTTGYTSQKNTSFGEATLYHYGNYTTKIGLTDFIHAARSVEDQYSFKLSEEGTGAYTNFDLQKVHNSSAIFPINSIFREDADVHIYFLSANGVFFKNPSDDAWYRVGTRPVNLTFVSATEAVTHLEYTASEPSSPLGCTDQHQLCSSVSGNLSCGPLASVRDALAGAAALFDTSFLGFAANDATSSPAALLTYFFQATSRARMSDLIDQFGPTSLLSQKYLESGFQHRLETDQWQLDVMHWWDMSMAFRQELFLDHAYSPTDPALLAHRDNFTAPKLKKLCDSQKMRSTAYGSFSLFGLVFIFLVGGSLVVTSYLLEPVATLLYDKKGYKRYQHLEWTSNATLQLQRLAQEEAGFGIWSNCTGAVPSTEANELLGSLDITNPDHPVLKPPGLEQSTLGDSRNSIGTSNTTQGHSQTEDEQSPIATPGSLPLQTTRLTDSRKWNAEVFQALKLTPNSGSVEAIIEPQGNESLPQGTSLAQGEKKGV
ncbi:hypothetical protein F5Y10DRAFT_282310 [Nemania abortiva]|nr:hypothetical protein F5Y10DRAFT_282310 [Nemania abortiva]